MSRSSSSVPYFLLFAVSVFVLVSGWVGEMLVAQQKMRTVHEFHLFKSFHDVSVWVYIMYAMIAGDSSSSDEGGSSRRHLNAARDGRNEVNNNISAKIHSISLGSRNELNSFLPPFVMPSGRAAIPCSQHQTECFSHLGGLSNVYSIYLLSACNLNMHKQADKEHGKRASKTASRQANMLASKIICLPSNIRLVVIKNAVCLFVCFIAYAVATLSGARLVNSRQHLSLPHFVVCSRIHRQHTHTMNNSHIWILPWFLINSNLGHKRVGKLNLAAVVVNIFIEAATSFGFGFGRIIPRAHHDAR